MIALTLVGSTCNMWTKVKNKRVACVHPLEEVKEDLFI